MKRCNKCGVNVDTKFEFCPLCYADLAETESKTTEEIFKTPKELDATKKKMHMVAKIFLILSAITIFASVYINVKTQTIAWSAIVTLSIVYVWVLVCHTIISQASPFKKVFLQLIVIIAFLLTTNFVFSNNDWLSNYVYPSLAMLVSIVLSFIVMCSKNHKRVILSFFSITILMAIASGVLLIFNLCDFGMLNEIALMVEGFILLAYVVLGGKLLLAEAGRKFHL